MQPLKNAIVIGIVHLFFQISVYICGFALGPTMATRKLLGISFYDIAVVVTFPFVYLAEHFQWRALGIGALPLNSFVWSTAAYLILLATEKLKRMKGHCGS